MRSRVQVSLPLPKNQGAALLQLLFFCPAAKCSTKFTAKIFVLNVEKIPLAKDFQADCAESVKIR